SIAISVSRGFLGLFVQVKMRWYPTAGQGQALSLRGLGALCQMRQALSLRGLGALCQMGQALSLRGLVALCRMGQALSLRGLGALCRTGASPVRCWGVWVSRGWLCLVG